VLRVDPPPGWGLSGAIYVDNNKSVLANAVFQHPQKDCDTEVGTERQMLAFTRSWITGNPEVTRAKVLCAVGVPHFVTGQEH